MHSNVTAGNSEWYRLYPRTKPTWTMTSIGRDGVGGKKSTENQRPSRSMPTILKYAKVRVEDKIMAPGYRIYDS